MYCHRVVAYNVTSGGAEDASVISIRLFAAPLTMSRREDNGNYDRAIDIGSPLLIDIPERILGKDISQDTHEIPLRKRAGAIA
jgi:hypothetical protein